LYLSGNQLTSLPPEIGQLSSLQSLYLSHNQLTSLPPEVSHLSSLQWLYLSSNQLTSLPPEIGQLSSLQSLYLSHNQLTSLPPEVSQLSSLQELYLYNNRLTSLPREISQLSSLLRLDVNANSLVVHTVPLNATLRGIDNQRLPTVLEATTFHLHDDDDDDDDDNNSDAGTNMPDFHIRFYSKPPTAQLSSPVPIAHRRSLAKRWPYFRHLLDAGLSEAQEGSADLSAYFSVRLGQCLVDYFEERPIQVSSLTPQDGRDFVAHADYFGLTDTLLFAFCTTKLKKKPTNLKKRKRQ
jgi:hypothetical protein